MSKESSTSRRLLYFGLATLAMIAVFLLPLPETIQTPSGPLDLSVSGKAALAVLAWAVILWATEGLPFAVTGMAAMSLLAATGVASFKNLAAWGFGNTIVLFFLGVLILSTALTETSLLKRLTIHLLNRLGHRPSMIVLVFIAVGALLSGWITDMAVAAMLLPIGVAILKDAGAKPLESNFGRALMIACAWGPLIGGISTPAGCGPNPLTMQYLKDLAGIEFTFLDWMLVGYPAALLMIPLGWLVLIKVFPIEKIDLSVAEHDTKKRLEELGPVTAREIGSLAIFFLMVALWLTSGWIQKIGGERFDFLGIAFVALACSCLFFLPGLDAISWKKAERGVSWGGIILIAAGLAMGKAIYETGAAGWLAYVVFHKLGVLHPVVMVFAVVFGISLLKVLFSSNTVTGAIMVPLLIALAVELKLDPALVAIPAGITASLAFILVTSTPTNVIPHSSGYFSIGDMAKAGLFMTVISSVCVTISICVFGPLFGIIEW
jgi:solute carrier family 13 (sodium-dependent dicarboxylate transporter), member 2/3/5